MSNCLQHAAAVDHSDIAARQLQRYRQHRRAPADASRCTLPGPSFATLHIDHADAGQTRHAAQRHSQRALVSDETCQAVVRDATCDSRLGKRHIERRGTGRRAAPRSGRRRHREYRRCGATPVASASRATPRQASRRRRRDTRPARITVALKRSAPPCRRNWRRLRPLPASDGCSAAPRPDSPDCACTAGVRLALESHAQTDWCARARNAEYGRLPAVRAPSASSSLRADQHVVEIHRAATRRAVRKRRRCRPDRAPRCSGKRPLPDAAPRSNARPRRGSLHDFDAARFAAQRGQRRCRRRAFAAPSISCTTSWFDTSIGRQTVRSSAEPRVSPTTIDRLAAEMHNAHFAGASGATSGDAVVPAPRRRKHRRVAECSRPARARRRGTRSMRLRIVSSATTTSGPNAARGAPARRARRVRRVRPPRCLPPAASAANAGTLAAAQARRARRDRPCRPRRQRLHHGPLPSRCSSASVRQAVS